MPPAESGLPGQSVLRVRLPLPPSSLVDWQSALQSGRLYANCLVKLERCEPKRLRLKVLSYYVELEPHSPTSSAVSSLERK